MTFKKGAFIEEQTPIYRPKFELISLATNEFPIASTTNVQIFLDGKLIRASYFKVEARAPGALQVTLEVLPRDITIALDSPQVNIIYDGNIYYRKVY